MSPTIVALLNVAGVPGTVGDELTMRVNFFGLRHLTELLWDRIVDGGTIVNVSSVAGRGMSEMGRRASSTQTRPSPWM